MILSQLCPHKILITLVTFGFLALQNAHSQEQGIINNAKSPHVTLRSTDIGACQWTSGFWADKFQLCEEVMVPHMGSLLKGDIGHGYNNFKIVAGLKEGKHEGTNWHDGDFYKWMESASYVYAINKEPKILAELDDIIGVIAKAQDDDGYLQTAVTLKKLGRYTNRQHHEMYNSGHLLTSACIHHRVTGKQNFLDIAIRHANHLCETFLPRPPELSRFGFNQTRIMGLVELYRTTGNKLDTKLIDGSAIRLTQETGYPWDGAVKITIGACKAEPFDLMLRIPGWADNGAIRINGRDAGVKTEPGNFATITRKWKKGDVVTLDLPMEPKLLVGHPRIEEVRNQATIKRGPVVYCVATPDLPKGTGILDIYIPSDIELKRKEQPDFLGGMTTLTGKVMLQPADTDAMYRPVGKPAWKPVETQFVPYYAWSNRGAAEMAVWLPIIWN